MQEMGRKGETTATKKATKMTSQCQSQEISSPRVKHNRGTTYAAAFTFPSRFWTCDLFFTLKYLVMF